MHATVVTIYLTYYYGLRSSYQIITSNRTNKYISNAILDHYWIILYSSWPRLPTITLYRPI